MSIAHLQPTKVKRYLLGSRRYGVYEYELEFTLDGLGGCSVVVAPSIAADVF